MDQSIPQPPRGVAGRSVAWVFGLIALLVTLSLATLGSLGLGFAVLTDCTDDYNCTSDGCAPCTAATHWINGGWIVQGLLVLVAVGLLVLAKRRWRTTVVAGFAVAVVALSLVTFYATGRAASQAYCQPGPDEFDHVPNSCPP